MAINALDCFVGDGRGVRGARIHIICCKCYHGNRFHARWWTNSVL